METAMPLRRDLLGLVRPALPVCALVAFSLHRAVAAEASTTLVQADNRKAEAPIASGQADNHRARADVLSLTRTEGDTVTLRFAIANEGNSNVSITMPNLRLIDLVNRRTYSPGVTSSSCLIPAGERRVCWAVFAAPNAGVRTVNVQFYEGFGLIPVPVGAPD